MPLKLDSRDRKIMLIAGIVVLLLIIASAFFAGGQGSKSETPTTYSSASDGAEGAYLLLQQSGFHSERWLRPLSELPDPAGKILILADPQEAPTQADRAQLEQFVSNGGRVIATGMYSGIFLPRSSSVPDFMAAMSWTRARALSFSAITRAAPEITLAPQAFWGGDYGATPLYGSGESVRVVKYEFGKGEIIWAASATPLTNAGLKEPGNLEFFLACLGDAAPSEVLWDEYIHGYRQTLGASVAHSGLIWIFLQLGLLSLAALATFSRRSGPIFIPAAEVRLSPLEFVSTLGGLYERAGAGSVAVDVCYQRFRYWLTRRLGMAGNASAGDLEKAVHDRWNLHDERLTNLLRECESARYDPGLGKEQALQLVQDLHRYAAELKLFRVSGKENQ